MPLGALLGGVLCVLAVGVLIGTLTGAIFLRAGIALHNKLAGGASSSNNVPEPEFGTAMLIIFTTYTIQIFVGFMIDIVTGLSAAAGGRKEVDIVAQLISFPVSLLVMATMLSKLLPTTFGRGFLVTLCYLLVVILGVGVVLGIVFAVYVFSLMETQ